MEANMKKTLIILAVLCLAVSGLAQEVKWFDGSFKDAMKEAATQKKLILINYFSGSG